MKCYWAENSSDCDGAVFDPYGRTTYGVCSAHWLIFCRAMVRLGLNPLYEVTNDSWAHASSVFTHEMMAELKEEMK